MLKNRTEQLNEIRRMLDPGALNDTEQIRKAGADIFANVGPEKPEEKPEVQQKRAKADPS